MLIKDVLSDVRRGVQFRRAERRAKRARSGRSPKVLVVGICQGAAVAQAMTLLLPEADVTFVSAFDAATRYSRMTDLIAESRRHDVTFSNTYLPVFKDGGTLATLRAETHLFVIPTIVFAAFHPDQVRVGLLDRPESGGLLGPLGHAHSALALFGYREGLGIDATLRLFDGAVYRALGYLGMWDASVTALRALGREADYDLDRDLVRWARRGCFMHSDNHPKMHVAADLARGLLEKAGIAYGDCDLDAYLADTMMSGGTWPVYPEIARHYGVPGNSHFLKVETPRTGPARTMTLGQFVAASFSRYGMVPQAQLVCERVAAWRADPAIHGMLRASAAG
ncbi:WcbI family polysaccharide biosynthesis putative acetyltransferase [Methylobacterium haplocladii]|uniref:Polysaccharide biosynthesis enzyme WcbI domain-containing protein n=1 Tax=Methylobacterium haplocladii TaxID=1176176 RepID=A0A512ILK6_9HYPH|nr:WcbI family polysaccharide biosynthesis putative acetyltransferase [Methylobacterium haplocladii]GEO98589.1 hypothetical protein MHA02_09770 [Methylobacterium haplocladii]GJD84011.1 hypothetical protein HPGCJGGD_1886 [Methylobacterium haplocladii]GLS59231.1 hypothetical protein GCM10007887_18970 [Methylobacterium haplocladii]